MSQVLNNEITKHPLICWHFSLPITNLKIVWKCTDIKIKKENSWEINKGRYSRKEKKEEMNQKGIEVGNATFMNKLFKLLYEISEFRVERL